MKLVNENIEDVLKPKSDRDVQTSIKMALENERPRYYVFIDEQEYDVYVEDFDPEDPDYGEYVGDYQGISYLPVYAYPGDLDAYQQDEIDNFSNNRDQFPEVGMAMVLFDMENDAEVKSVEPRPSASKKYSIQEIDPWDVNVLHPSLW